MTWAFGASALMSDNTPLSDAGSVLSACASALWTALTQLLVDSSTQVSITPENPTSLPPTVIDTSVVELLRAPSCVEITLLVVAPEQVSLANEAGALALAQSTG